MNLYLGDHTVLTRLEFGPVMFLDSRDPVNVSIMLNGNWETWITKAFMSVIKPGMTVLDIGAHHGYFSILAGMLVGPTGSVHSFEPNPFHHKNFLKSVSFNGMFRRVNLHKVMLSNCRGETEIGTSGEGGTSIQFLGAEEINGVTKWKVQQGILTDYLPSLKADVIKIDIDGGEPLIMDSLFQVIDHNPSIYIFMEYAPMLWKGTNPMTVLHRFAVRGFRFHILQRNGQITATTAAELAALRMTTDYLDLMLMR